MFDQYILSGTFDEYEVFLPGLGYSVPTNTFSARTSFEKCDPQFVSLFDTLTHENVKDVFTVGC